ncbi:MAG: hypothetical protein MJE66_00335 [Proteobacteria bacterium]|nr:hypothetical protein [Pseudomonadota bacterium]
MKPPGSFRIARRGRRFEFGTDLPFPLDHRVQRIVESLRSQIQDSDSEHRLRVRKVFADPEEIYRVELEVPSLCYQRVTLLDRDALEELMEIDEVRNLVSDREAAN